MDPVTVIVAALAAGAAAGGQDAAKDAVRDSYRALRDLLTRLGKGAQVAGVEAAPPANADALPGSGAAQELEKVLRTEPEGMLVALVPAAQRLEASVATAQGSQRWSVTYLDCTNVQTGDHNTMTTHHAPAREPSP